MRNVQRTLEVWLEFILFQSEPSWCQADCYRILVHFFPNCSKQGLVKTSQSSKMIQYRASFKEHKLKTMTVKLEGGFGEGLCM